MLYRVDGVISQDEHAPSFWALFSRGSEPGALFCVPRVSGEEPTV